MQLLLFPFLVVSIYSDPNTSQAQLANDRYAQLANDRYVQFINNVVFKHDRNEDKEVNMQFNAINELQIDELISQFQKQQHMRQPELVDKDKYCMIFGATEQTMKTIWDIKHRVVKYWDSLMIDNQVVFMTKQYYKMVVVVVIVLMIINIHNITYTVLQLLLKYFMFQDYHQFINNLNTNHNPNTKANQNTKNQNQDQDQDDPESTINLIYFSSIESSEQDIKSQVDLILEPRTFRPNNNSNSV